MGSRWIIFCIFSFILASHSFVVFANSQELQKTVTVGINHIPPWVIEAEGKPPAGVDIEVITHLLNSVGLKPEFIPCPFARCLKLIENGQIDIITSLFKMPEREHYAHFIEPFLMTDPPKVFYLRAKADFDIKRYSDLLGKSIGVHRDSSYFMRFDNDTDLRKAVLSEESKLIELLLKQRIDTFIGTASSIDYLLQEQKLTNQITKASFAGATERKTYVAISKRSKFLPYAKKIGDSIETMKQTGLLDNLVSKW